MSNQKKPFDDFPPMIRAEARDRARPFLAWYLKTKLHVSLSHNFSCLNPDHVDTNPSMSFDKRRNKVRCFACEVDWDIFDVAMAHEELESLDAAFTFVYDMLGIEIKDDPGGILDTLYKVSPGIVPFSPCLDEGEEEHPVHDYTTYLTACHDDLCNHQEAIDYLTQGRGLSASTVTRFRLGYDSATKSITIPYNSDNTYYIGRGLDGAAIKHRKPKTEEAGPEPVFNPAALHSDGPVYVVESPLCAISIEQVGGHAVAVGGLGQEKLLKYLRESPTNAILILALDNDEGGRRAQQRLVDTLREAGNPFIEYNVAGAHKDVNEALQSAPDVLRESVAAGCKAAKEVTADTALSLYRQSYSAALAVPGFLERVKQSVTQPVISTGFSNLDDILDGGLHEGLYILGAISSLGKTTLALQIADNIAQNGQDVLIISLEMSKDELMAKSISRNTLLVCQKTERPSLFAKTTRGILSGRLYPSYSEPEQKVIDAAVARYTEYADRVYIVESAGQIGATEIRKIVEQHINTTGNTPMVLVDYLQILKPHDPRSSDKQNTDFAVGELKRISRDFHAPVLAVSSFNRDNYKVQANMAAFKESGAIEYSSDVLLGLQLKGVGTTGFDAEAAKERDPRLIECRIIKNRNGRTGIVDYTFFPKFNLFEEPPMFDAAKQIK